MKRAIVAMLRTPGDPYWRFKFEEFKRLVRAAGYIVADEVIQTKEKPKSATLFGRGKINEIKLRAEEVGASVIAIYNTLKSIQKVNLELLLGRTVVDRYEITLEIFAKNAHDTVSKLQIELARLKYELPYVRLMVNARFRGERVFFGAGGEYKWKVILSEVKRRIKRLNEEIEKRRAEKTRIINARKREGFKIVSIVGYYNAGKTSIFNALTGENKPVSDFPFTTVSSKYSRALGASKLLLVDTIGFVIDLDPRIISSFEFNIDDMRFSDALIYVLDSSDPIEWANIKFKTAMKILLREKIIGEDDKKALVIALNKVDQVKDILHLRTIEESIKNELNKLSMNEIPIVEVSAKNKLGLNELIRVLIDKLKLSE